MDFMDFSMDGLTALNDFKRPDNVHLYKAENFVLIHASPQSLWWPIRRELRDAERYGSDDAAHISRLRKESDTLHEIFKRAQSVILKERKEAKERARQEAQANNEIEEMEVWECNYEEDHYHEDEENEYEGIYLNMFCSIELDERLPASCLQRLIQMDLDQDSTKLAAKAYFKVEPTFEKLSRIKVDNPIELNLLLQVINRVHSGLWEVEISNHQYKVNLHFKLVNGWGWTEVRAEIPIRLGDFVFTETRSVADDIFQTKGRTAISITPMEALAKMKVTPTGERTDEDYALIEEAKKMNNQIGIQVSTTGEFIQKLEHWWSIGLVFHAHGSKEKPQKAIIEPKLGLESDGERDRDREAKSNELPLVRCFSLNRKSYGFFDVRDVEEYVYDKNLLDQLVMPEAKKNVLTSVISAKPGSVMADIVRGKHGGFVVLAAGPTGVGKTLTAEAVSEWLERPLYAVEVAELGTDVDKLETTLSEIFTRASRWNAILLFDEADVFLAKRNLDLERSAIVGVFLRLMDYHDGVIFMTTNRADIIDPAMFSRLSMMLEYKPLRRAARKSVWDVMFTEDKELKTLSNALSKLPLNGRQIRNTARVIRALNSQRKTTITEAEVFEITATATRARLTLYRRFMSWLGY